MIECWLAKDNIEGTRISRLKLFPDKPAKGCDNYWRCVHGDYITLPHHYFQELDCTDEAIKVYLIQENFTELSSYTERFSTSSIYTVKGDKYFRFNFVVDFWTAGKAEDWKELLDHTNYYIIPEERLVTDNK